MSSAETRYPPWHGPHGDSKLKVNNSLTGTKVPFVPRNGNNVSFYICGPTVYDSSHLGHARAYITFDILRRILEDFFKYDVTMAMNITDVDDKIILRARQNFLLRQYVQECTDTAQAIQDIHDAFSAMRASLKAKIARSEEEVKTAEARHRADMLAAINGEGLKLEAMEKSCVKFCAKAEELKASTKPEDREMLIWFGKDVLSKMLDDAKGASVTDQSIYRAHTARYEKEFMDDLSALGIRRPDVITRVTEYVPEIIQFVEKIISNGFAYVTADGSVYFDVAAFQKAGHNYGKLAPWCVGNMDLLADGEGALASSTCGKRSPSDFAVWKASKPGEPFWVSPWGNGRPGWHIECSAMCSDILGDNIDIHGGGEDLKFPHHDNELAQCEGHSLSNQWVNHFWHAGHLNIQGLKMSKSLKNFISIGEVLKRNSARQLRILFLLQAWDRPMNYSDASLEEATAKETTLKHFFGTIKALRRQERSLTAEEKWNDNDRKLNAAMEQTRVSVRAALEDNFDYPKAMSEIFELVNVTNSALTGSPKILLLCKIATFVDSILRMFGVMQDNDFGFQSGGAVNKEDIIAKYMDAFATFRTQVRMAAIESKDKKMLALCDDLREEIMPELGVMLEDVQGSSIWKLDDPVILVRAREKKKAEAREKKIAALTKKLTSRTKEVTKWSAAATPPQQFFAENKAYSEFNEEGLPSLEDGKAIPKSALKKLRKMLQAHAKVHAQLAKKEASFTAALSAEVELLQADFLALTGSAFVLA